MSQWNNMLKLKSLPFGGIHSISDPTMDVEVTEIMHDVINENCLDDADIHFKFIIEYKKWLLSSKNNTLLGLENFNSLAFCNGTTEAFDKFYLKHRERRLRFFKGEYMYHVAIGKNYFSEVLNLEDGPISNNDVVVISYPFANNGNKHIDMDRILSECDQKNIPVLVDCAYINLAGGLVFDFNHPCIEEIVFSLSKTFPVGYLRIGMRLTKTDKDDPLDVYNKNKYVNRFAAAVGLKLIKKFDVDRNYNLYRSVQLKFCKELGIDPSPVVVLGTSKEKYQEYNRGGAENRLCFSKFLYNEKLS